MSAGVATLPIDESTSDEGRRQCESGGTLVLNRVMRGALLGAVTVLLASCSGAPPAPSPAAPTDTPADTAAAITPARLQSLWWSWASSAPPGRSPVEDTTGAVCADNQPTEVWLVAGTFGGRAERRCQVPAGVSIAGPAVNAVTPDAEACTSFLAGARGDVVLDGAPEAVESIEPTEITYDAVDGRYRGFGCGLWFRLPPLSPGEHTLVISGSSGEFATEARYVLTVSRSA
ncbi:hypothetical protein [Pseudonocardia sp. TRM90224]|uniref:hypothetical protein n=1 Tax=Pseudonocardia sp. TRM90224 TaxID=2812678 RepID=UPI001E4E90CD|nr:hypothetical protein [Pseudonocardia sp. TRM90224]